MVLLAGDLGAGEEIKLAGTYIHNASYVDSTYRIRALLATVLNQCYEMSTGIIGQPLPEHRAPSGRWK